MADIKELDRKYAQLLLRKCLCFKNTDTLLIEYMTHEHDDFVKIIVEEAKKMDIKDIVLCCNDSDEVRKYLANTEIDEIKLNPLIDRSSWDEVAKRHGCILHINTFIPNLMNDIESEKIRKMNQAIAPTFSYYRANNKYNFPWVICAYPNKRWAEFLFKNDSDAYLKLYDYIIKMCMVDSNDPSRSWDESINNLNEYKEKLQDMQIKKLSYKNELGTDFEIGFPKNYKWINLDKRDNYGNPIIVNMPSYEIFTTPDYRTANGIVFNSRPLVFHNNIIDNFYIEFKDGVAVNYKAKIGNELLKELIENSKNSNRLGEVALVNNNSPISNTGIIFYNTLFDENASCHLALGRGNPSTVVNYQNMTPEELNDVGINNSNVHVDFMVGTPDLEIVADTETGKKLVFKKGNFII
jgi:aminopeptidase